MFKLVTDAGATMVGAKEKIFCFFTPLDCWKMTLSDQKRHYKCPLMKIPVGSRNFLSRSGFDKSKICRVRERTLFYFSTYVHFCVAYSINYSSVRENVVKKILVAVLELATSGQNIM